MRSPPRRRPILVTLGLGLAAGLLAGCRTTDPLLLAEGGVHFRDLEAAAYRIAVAPFEVDPSLEPASLGAAAPERLHEALAAALADVEAGSDIVPLSTRSSFDAYAAKADILVLPRLEQASFGPAPDSGKVLVSSLLWLTTWIGSLWVEDRSYETGVVVSYDLVDPHTGAPVAGGIKARSGQVGLTFWERDHAFSRGFFLSMLVPPFLVAGDPEAEAEALVRRSAALLAAQVKAYLLGSLPERELSFLAHVQVRAPRNGSLVQGTTPLRCDIVARRAVTEVLVLVDDEVLRRWGEGELPAPADQAREGYFVCPVRVEGLELKGPGRSIVRVLVNVAGQWASRSVAVRCVGPPGPPGAPKLSYGAPGEAVR